MESNGMEWNGIKSWTTSWMKNSIENFMDYIEDVEYNSKRLLHRLLRHWFRCEFFFTIRKEKLHPFPSQFVYDVDIRIFDILAKNKFTKKCDFKNGKFLCISTIHSSCIKKCKCILNKVRSICCLLLLNFPTLIHFGYNAFDIHPV